MFKIVLLFCLLGHIFACNKLQTENGYVCVCNSTHCDAAPGLEDLTASNIKVYTTSDTTPGFNVVNLQFEAEIDDSAIQIALTEDVHQTIIGFGGAFTDAAGINILSLPEEEQDKLLESYFGEDGIGYSLCRVPVGGTDFSPRPYSLDDHDGDTQLEFFGLQGEDLIFKIPMIQKAKALRGDNTLNLFASAWTAPPWMKSNQVWSMGFSMLKPENYQVWANYFIKFFDAYLEYDIPFWGLTTGNEPINGFVPLNPVNNMGWTTSGQGKWIVENIGPALRNSTSHSHIKLMIHDENINILPFDVPWLLSKEDSLEYIDGVATHWYSDGSMYPEVRNLAKTDKKDTFIISSEACHFVTTPLLGSWDRAAQYAENIILDLEYGYGGWVDWNMVLNSTGGFTYINVPSDAAIVLNEQQTEFYKQPMFYILGHFSKFVVPGSIRLSVDSSGADGLQVLAFQRPDNLKVVTVYYSGTSSLNVQLSQDTRHSEVIEILPKSINTLIYQD